MTANRLVMTLLWFLAAGIPAWPLFAGPAAADPVSPPNIVLILIDDLGWMDLACQGNRLVETPNIDRFAREGIRFTDAYAAAPVCSPTRASILTGLSPARLQITNHIPDQKRFIPKNPKLLPAAMMNHLPLEHTTIAERLRAAGYRTGFIGKWHLSEGGSVRNGGVGDARGPRSPPPRAHSARTLHAHFPAAPAGAVECRGLRAVGWPQ